MNFENSKCLSSQQKQKEIDFFDNFASNNEYNVFTEETNNDIVDKFESLSEAKHGQYVADLGCGTGIFSNLLARKGYITTGVDLSPKMIEIARGRYSHINFQVGDVEDLSFASNSLDHVLLSGIIHHLPNPSKCAKEVYRVLKPGGTFVAFDPNRRNPFMYLYRDKSSPFYSSNGVTENERPVLVEHVVDVFDDVGFEVGTAYLSGLQYRYVASCFARSILPIYNAVDKYLFMPSFMAPYSAFVFTHGNK